MPSTTSRRETHYDSHTRDRIDFFAGGATGNVGSQESSFSFDPDERLFTVYAPMNFGGYDHDWADKHRIRVKVAKAVREKLSGQLGREYRNYYKQHGGDFSGFGTAVLLLDGPSDFSMRDVDFSLSGEHADHVREVADRFEGLGEILASFHRDAEIPFLWGEYGTRIAELNRAYEPFGQLAIDQIVSYCRLDSSYFEDEAARIHFTICPQMSHFTAYTTKIEGELHIVHGPPSGAPGPGAFFHETLHHVVGPILDGNLGLLDKSVALLPVSKQHGDMGYPEWRDVVEESFVRTLSKVLSARITN